MRNLPLKAAAHVWRHEIECARNCMRCTQWTSSSGHKKTFALQCTHQTGTRTTSATSPKCECNSFIEIFAADFCGQETWTKIFTWDRKNKSKWWKMLIYRITACRRHFLGRKIDSLWSRWRCWGLIDGNIVGNPMETKNIEEKRNFVWFVGGARRWSLQSKVQIFLQLIKKLRNMCSLFTPFTTAHSPGQRILNANSIDWNSNIVSQFFPSFRLSTTLFELACLDLIKCKWIINEFELCAGDIFLKRSSSHVWRRRWGRLHSYIYLFCSTRARLISIQHWMRSNAYKRLTRDEHWTLSCEHAVMRAGQM